MFFGVGNIHQFYKFYHAGAIIIIWLNVFLSDVLKNIHILKLNGTRLVCHVDYRVYMFFHDMVLQFYATVLVQSEIYGCLI